MCVHCACDATPSRISNGAHIAYPSEMETQIVGGKFVTLCELRPQFTAWSALRLLLSVDDTYIWTSEKTPARISSQAHYTFNTSAGILIGSERAIAIHIKVCEIPYHTNSCHCSASVNFDLKEILVRTISIIACFRSYRFWVTKNMRSTKFLVAMQTAAMPRTTS